MSISRLIVGLGNPGDEYAETRHNAGFMVADELAKGAGETWSTEDKWPAATARIGDTLVIKPLSFMNDSGAPVRKLADYYKLGPEALVIITDDVDLPFGEFRFRDTGGSAGQKGVASILLVFGTEEIPRLRIGIGRSELTGTTGHVLSRFSADESAKLPEVLRQAVAELKRHEL